MTLPEKKTTFVFKCFENESSELKIRLRYDGLTQTHFFRSLMKMYISKHPKMMDIVSLIKQDQKSIGKKKIQRSKNEINNGKQLLDILGITDSDRSKIFDIIESGEEEYE